MNSILFAAVKLQRHHDSHGGGDLVHMVTRKLPRSGVNLFCMQESDHFSDSEVHSLSSRFMHTHEYYL